MTDLLNPPTNGTSTRKLKTDLVDAIGEVLDSLSPESRAPFLALLTALRSLPPADLDTATKGVSRVMAKAGTDGANDALLADIIHMMRKEVRR